MEDEVREHGLLERRLEGLNELVGQLLDESDGVREQVVAPVMLEGPGGRVQRLEEAVANRHFGAGERVQQRRLARVGVAGERDLGHRRRLAALAHDAAGALETPEAPAQRRDAVAGKAAVGLDLRLARAPGADAAVHPARAEALEVGPEAPHPREVVLELCELNLQLAFRRVRVRGENVEDDRRAVDHRDLELGLKVALLPRRQLVVDGHEVRVGPLDSLLQLDELAAPEIAVGVGLRAVLDHRPGRRHAGCAQQLAQLGEILVAVPGINPDGQRPLGGARHPGIR